VTNSFLDRLADLVERDVRESLGDQGARLPEGEIERLVERELREIASDLYVMVSERNSP
jgi:hypothetical protein